jgi:hypothetical protein
MLWIVCPEPPSLARGVSQSATIPSEALAAGLERKMLEIEAAEAGKRTTPDTIEVSEAELESYALYRLGEDLSIRLDSVDLEIRPGMFRATVDMFVARDLASSHPIVGPLFEGRHTVFFDGALVARGGRGTFTLQRVNVDGIRVPVFLVKALLVSLDEPVDLDAPFDTPIGIHDVVLVDRAVRVTY